MSIAYPSYSPRPHQVIDQPSPLTPAHRPVPGAQESNVRAASNGLLANRMDALSLQVGRLACYGLE